MRPPPVLPAVVANDAYAQAAVGIASDIRELPPADEALTLLAALA